MRRRELPSQLLLLPVLLLALGCPAGDGPDGPSEEVIRHNIIGTAYLGQQKWLDAENSFREAAELAPDEAVPLNNIAVAISPTQPPFAARTTTSPVSRSVAVT